MHRRGPVRGPGVAGRGARRRRPARVGRSRGRLAVPPAHALSRRAPRPRPTAFARARRRASGAGRLDLRDRAGVHDRSRGRARPRRRALGPGASRAGGCEVGIHIADVSWYVRRGQRARRARRASAARAATCRAASCPMLPERLSADLCSLRDGRRPPGALGARRCSTTTGALHEYRFAETVIRSRASLHVRAGAGGAGRRSAAARRACSDARAAADARWRARCARAASRSARSRSNRPRSRRAWTSTACRSRIERRPHLESHELIEEFMLLANRCVGEAGAVRERRHAVARPRAARSRASSPSSTRCSRVLGLPRLGARRTSRTGRCRPCSRVPLDPAQRRHACTAWCCAR